VGRLGSGMKPLAGERVSKVDMMNQQSEQTQLRQLVEYARGCSFDNLPDAGKIQLKIRVLDTIGCAIGALPAPPMSAIRSQIEEFCGEGPCTLIGGGSAPPDRAAFYNSALVRFLDLNDVYVARGETCQPSNNLGAVLAAAETARGSGESFLDALTCSYQVQCLLADKAPVTAKGFDVAAHGSYAAAAGAAKALGLNLKQTENAVAIAGAANNPLAVRRPGMASDWKRLAHPAAAGSAVHAVLMAARGITGPPNVMEGTKGFMESVAGEFEVSWMSGQPERVTRSNIRRYSGSLRAQSCVEGVVELRSRYEFEPENVRHVDVDMPPDAFSELNPGPVDLPVTSREQAAESLPFMVAAALVDGELTPVQYEPGRIDRPELQNLLGRIRIRRQIPASGAAPEKLPCHIRILLDNGWMLKRAKSDYEGHHTRPLTFPDVHRKFQRLTEGRIDKRLRTEIADTVARLEALQISDLTDLLRECEAHH